MLKSWGGIVAVVLAFAVGVALAFTYHSLSDPTTSATFAPTRAPLTPVGALTTTAATDSAAVGVPTPTDPPDPPAASAHDAVVQFLSAEVAQDFEESYGFLSAPDRAKVSTRAAWVAAHGGMAPILAFGTPNVATGAARAAVTVNLDLRSGLDQVNGLVTARAVGTYVVVAEDGGWRVANADSSVKPVYPTDTLAPNAVRGWATARQDCRKPAEYTGGLLGTPRPADALCHARGPVRVGAVTALPETDAAEPFLAAFGPAVYEWARVVPLRAPDRMDVVVAPVGDQWLPIGVLRGDPVVVTRVSPSPTQSLNKKEEAMRNVRKLLRRALPVLLAVGALGLSSLAVGGASSHREAPLIADDPNADATDTYAFVSPDKPDTVTLVGNWVPFEEPAGGPNYSHFGDDVRYDFDVDNNGDNVPDIVYQFTFKTTVASDDTFLYNTGPIESIDSKNLNVKQTYTITQVKGGKSTVLESDIPVAPANIGPRSTPNYDALAAQAVKTLSDGSTVFAGPRDDPFYVDLGSVFDLLGLRPLNQAHAIKLPTTAGVDNLAGYNVHSIVLQVPITNVTTTADPVIGVWTSTYRRQVRMVRDDGTLDNKGPWTQVSRLGMPLVNEVVIPRGKKDRFNASSPSGDAQFLPFVQDPEPSKLIPVLYPGVKVPSAPRKDLVSIFVTGIDGVNMPKGVKGGEMLRLNTSITSTPLAQQSRLGLLAGQNDGFPNGRRLVDDVTDIELRALAGGTPFTADFDISPNNALTDGVDKNDVAFLGVFPYLASPHQGYEIKPHS